MTDIISFKEKKKTQMEKEKEIMQFVGIDGIASGLFQQKHIRILAMLPLQQARVIIGDLKKRREEIEKWDQKGLLALAEYKKEVFKTLQEKKKALHVPAS